MDIYHSPPFNTNFLVLVPTLALTLILILMLISIVTQQIEAPPPQFSPHMHCCIVSQTNNTTYTHMHCALHCAAMQGREWHCEHGTCEHVNNGGGEGRSAGQLRPW